MTKPTIGRMTTRSVHKILVPPEAELPMMLTTAQMSRASTIRPKTNSKADPFDCRGNDSRRQRRECLNQPLVPAKGSDDQGAASSSDHLHKLSGASNLTL